MSHKRAYIASLNGLFCSIKEPILESGIGHIIRHYISIDYIGI